MKITNEDSYGEALVTFEYLLNLTTERELTQREEEELDDLCDAIEEYEEYHCPNENN